MPYTLMEGEELQKFLDEIEVEGDGDVGEEEEVSMPDA
jgi:hypothetical protein